MSRQIGNVDCRLGMKGTQKHRTKKVTGNSFCTTTFTYEIRHVNPLTETLLLSHYIKHYFSHTIHGKYSEL
jgi:hypothetical protein